jgi:hypothetical protein
VSDVAALGRFAVVGTAEEVDAFCRATGAAAGPTLPLTFPMRWLVAPGVRTALLDLVGDADIVLVHESQSFAYTSPLRIGDLYALDLTARRETAPDRLILDGAVIDSSGGEQARIETILRLIAVPAEMSA